MNKETKKCPYCGEEILATARKCRYCRSWLVPQDEAQPFESTAQEGGELKQSVGAIEDLSQEEENVDFEEEDLVDDTENEEENSPEQEFYLAAPLHYQIVNAAYLLAVFGCACSAVHSVFGGGCEFGYGKLANVAEFLSLMPKWVGALMECAGGILLFYSFMQGIKCVLPSLKKWLVAIMVFNVIITFVDIFVEKIEVSSFDVFLGLCYIACFVIVGLAIKKIESFADVGWGFLLVPIVFLCGLTVAEVVGEDTEFGVVVEFLASLAPCIVYYTIREKYISICA